MVANFTKIPEVLIRHEILIVGGFQNIFFADRSSLNGENTVNNFSEVAFRYNFKSDESA